MAAVGEPALPTQDAVAAAAAAPDTVPEGSDRKRKQPEPETTPSKKPRRSSTAGSSSKGPTRRKVIPEEPKQPVAPPHAFKLFAEEKWPVLVGEPSDRTEQAKLMWKALPSEDRASLQKRAAELQTEYVEACEKYKLNLEAWKKALPASARAELKRKDKEAAQAEKARAKEEKEMAKGFRVTLKEMGDRIKSNLQICRFGPRRGGVWTVPDGQLRFSKVSVELFRFVFGGYFRLDDPTSSTVSFRLSKMQAGNIFGVTKLRGGSMYAKFEVRSMTVTYRPHEQALDLAYAMEDAF